MTEILIQISTARSAGVSLEELPDEVRAKLLPAVTGLTAHLAANVTGEAPNRTGELRSTIAQKVYDDPKQIRGVVFADSDFGKAAALEYGARRSGMVKAHAMRLNHIYSRLISPIVVMVQAHNQRRNIAERRFMRGPLSGMEGEVVSTLQEAVASAATEANR